MRILYSAGDRIGANTQLVRFFENASVDHEIKIAAYAKSSYSFDHIDWTLDSLHYNTLRPKNSNALIELFGHGGVPLVNLDNVTAFVTESLDFEPDLIISDGEIISAHMAKAAEIPLWYCSPLHLFDGIHWSDIGYKYAALLSAAKQRILTFPKADRTFIYSPFGDLYNAPKLKEGFEWITPYHVDAKSSSVTFNKVAIFNEKSRLHELTKITNMSRHNLDVFSSIDRSDLATNVLSTDNVVYRNKITCCDKLMTTGETSYIADAIYNNKSLCITPTLNDPESLLNAIIVSQLDLGNNIGQVELMDMYSLDVFDDALDVVFEDVRFNKKTKLLHERINDEISMYSI